MNAYGNIGKINIIPALGLARNMSTEIDRKASGCLSCPYYASIIRGEKSADHCALCAKKKNLYQNEKARYGYKESLTKAELFVFIALHLYGPSSEGIITDVSAVRLAEECQISPKTAYDVLNGLAIKGYIYLNTDIRGSYTILIRNYDQYFASAKKGGRGYIVITRAFFNQLLSVKRNINAVRYTLRAYINIDMDAKGNYTHELVHTETMKQALSYLPKYMRPCDLHKIIAKTLPSMLSLVKDIGKNIILRLDPEYYGPALKQHILEEEADVFRTQLEETLDFLNRKEAGIISLADMPETAQAAHVSLVHLKAKLKKPFLKPEDLVLTDQKSLLSLAQIALEYGRRRVWEALKQTWHDWRPGKADQASYIRTILVKGNTSA